MKALAGFAGSSEQRYEIVRKIAAGGMATVYLGRGVGALGFERPVAIKACHPHLLDAGDRTQSVLDEARVAALIRHPNVVATLDVTLSGDSVMIVMEYVEGRRATSARCPPRSRCASRKTRSPGCMPPTSSAEKTGASLASCIAMCRRRT